MNENRSEWVRIGAEENDAPWCREFDDRSGIQLVADADILHEAVLGLAYDELDAIPRVAAYKARIAELETENAILKAAVECWKTEQFVNQQSARIAELEAALAHVLGRYAEFDEDGWCHSCWQNGRHETGCEYQKAAKLIEEGK